MQIAGTVACFGAGRRTNFLFFQKRIGSSTFDVPVHARNNCDVRDLQLWGLRTGVMLGCAGIVGSMLLGVLGTPARIWLAQLGRRETHMHWRMKNA